MELTELQRQTLEILQDHRGKENAITSEELSDRLGGIDRLDSTPKTRMQLIRPLLVEHGYPVASWGGGYFLLSSEEEKEEYIAHLQDRIAGIEERIDSVEQAFDETGSFRRNEAESLDDFLGVWD